MNWHFFFSYEISDWQNAMQNVTKKKSILQYQSAKNAILRAVAFFRRMSTLYLHFLDLIGFCHMSFRLVTILYNITLIEIWKEFAH